MLALTKENQSLLAQVETVLANTQADGMTNIQITRFILNDVEYPTPYGKFVQACFELQSRVEKLRQFAFDQRRLTIQMQIAQRDAEQASDPLRGQLHELRIEELRVRLDGLERSVMTTLREMASFYSLVAVHPEFHDVSPEEREALEQGQWAYKAANMSAVFEERYGEKFLREAWGDEPYERFRALRRASFGYLPRELTAAALDDDAWAEAQQRLLGLGGASRAAVLPAVPSAAEIARATQLAKPSPAKPGAVGS